MVQPKEPKHSCSLGWTPVAISPVCRRASGMFSDEGVASGSRTLGDSELGALCFNGFGLRARVTRCSNQWDNHLQLLASPHPMSQIPIKPTLRHEVILVHLVSMQARQLQPMPGSKFNFCLQHSEENNSEPPKALRLLWRLHPVPQEQRGTRHGSGACK